MSGSKDCIRIIIADDHQIFREGLINLLEIQSDFSVVAQANNGKTLVELTEQHLPEIVILDISMPELTGIEATRIINNKYPHIKLLALSMHSDIDTVRNMLHAGASGFLLKDSAFDELCYAIRDIQRGKLYFCDKIDKSLKKDYIDTLRNADSPQLNILTTREIEILKLLANGSLSKEIAFELNLSSRTVDTHKRNIMQKLDIHTLPQLTKFAIRKNLISVD